jgi:hypothetical protein
MIDHRYRFIFIHQRKAAGISIADAFGLSKESDFDNLDSDFHRFNEGTISWDWNGRTEDEKKYFVFSAVRNPFDRLISAWKFLDNTRNRTLLNVLNDMPLQSPDYEHLTRPQIEILREPGTAKLVVDDLIRFETLQSDFDRVCDRIGRPRFALRHLNYSQREPGYRHYFDRQTRRLVEAHFAEDLEVFGYRF